VSGVRPISVAAEMEVLPKLAVRVSAVLDICFRENEKESRENEGNFEAGFVALAAPCQRERRLASAAKSCRQPSGGSFDVQ